MDKNSAFVKGTVRFAVALAALLIVLGCRFWTVLPDIYEDRISALAAAGKPEAAIEKYDRLKVVVAERLDDETKDSCEYAIAQGWMIAGDYEQAQYMFSALGDFRDSAQMVKECIYLPAQELFEEGKYDEAAEIFRSLGIYSDSADRYKDCRMAIAELLYQAGEYSEAINVFREVGDYNGALDRIYDIAMELTGDEEFAQEMVSGKLSEADQEIMLAREYARQKLKTESIAAGKNHTVAILSDGSVAAIGDNSFGQCDVSGWTDVVAVYAGANFTLGLRSDGSVLAAGDNTHGQCDVSGWSGVKKLAVGDHDTLALTGEGKLLFTGYHDYSDTLAAENIKEVFAGSYQGACILEDGTVLTSNKSSQTTLKPEAIALSTAVSVYLMSDGSTSSTFERVPEWKDIISLSMSSRAVLGLTTEGEVESFFFRESDAVDFDVSGKYIVAAAAGGGHYILVDSDGKVYAYGDNAYGQCDVSGWKIK